MWDLLFTGDLVTGFRREEVIDNLAKMLKKNPNVVKKELFTGKSVQVKRVDSEHEARQLRQHFADAGALLMVMPAAEEVPGVSPYAGMDPGNRNIAEPTVASVFARVPALRRRNHAFAFLGMTVLACIVVFILVLKIFQ